MGLTVHLEKDERVEGRGQLWLGYFCVESRTFSATAGTGVRDLVWKYKFGNYQCRGIVHILTLMGISVLRNI